MPRRCRGSDVTWDRLSSRWRRQWERAKQTISEWEKGLWRPRGVSVTLLNIIAERAEFVYRADSKENDSARPS